MANTNLGRVQGSSFWATSVPLSNYGTSQYQGTIRVQKINEKAISPLAGDFVVNSSNGSVYRIQEVGTSTDNTGYIDYVIYTTSRTAEFSIKGAQGEQGIQGEQGPQGIQGPAGAEGAKGDTGATGPQGPQGEKGDKGDKGDTGEQGPQGPAGQDGKDGLSANIVDLNELVPTFQFPEAEEFTTSFDISEDIFNKLTSQNTIIKITAEGNTFFLQQQMCFSGFTSFYALFMPSPNTVKYLAIQTLTQSTSQTQGFSFTLFSTTIVTPTNDEIKNLITANPKYTISVDGDTLTIKENY